MINSKTRASAGPGIGILAITGNAPLFALTSAFTGSSRGAREDVRYKMQLAQDLASQDQQRILGALLFTCNGRGRQMFNHDANDARLFQAHFPLAPLLGYYAGGEIGPCAADDDGP